MKTESYKLLDFWGEKNRVSVINKQSTQAPKETTK